MNLNDGHTSSGQQMEGSVFSSTDHFFWINKSIYIIEVGSKAQCIGFVWTQTTQELSKIKEGETFSTWNQIIYSKQEIPRKFKF